MILKKIKKAHNSKLLVLPGSKSISNRILIITFLKNIKTRFINLSKAKDTALLIKAIQSLKKNRKVYYLNLENDGTAYRFLTSLLANRTGKYYLLCSKEMENRPIKELVESLKEIGAEIYYLKKEGFPPLKIIGKNLKFEKITIDASKSSQFVSSLVLLATCKNYPIEIFLKKSIPSMPYLMQTLEIIKFFGHTYTFENNQITIYPAKQLRIDKIQIESDWSAAAVWYAFVSLIDNKNFSIKLSKLHKNSIQGDAILADLYENLGVKTSFLEHQTILLEKNNFYTKYFEFDAISNPDIVPTLVINLVLLNIPFKIKNIKNLRIKECDRIMALEKICEQINIKFTIEENQIIYHPQKPIETDRYLEIEDFNDHRIVMAAALLSSQYNIKIQNPQAVEKSYPSFWKDYKKVFNKSLFGLI